MCPGPFCTICPFFLFPSCGTFLPYIWLVCMPYRCLLSMLPSTVFTLILAAILLKLPLSLGLLVAVLVMLCLSCHDCLAYLIIIWSYPLLVLLTLLVLSFPSSYRFSHPPFFRKDKERRSKEEDGEGEGGG